MTSMLGKRSSAQMANGMAQSQPDYSGKRARKVVSDVCPLCLLACVLAAHLKCI